MLLVDLVESVRLMQEHEDRAVRRRAEFVRIVDTQILPRYDGVMVKSLGDGLLTRFESVADAVNAAAEMHRTLSTQNAALPEDQHFHLSARLNAAMACCAGDPCETRRNDQQRRSARRAYACEDLGDCILKHFDKPARAYRVGPASPKPGPTERPGFGTPMEPTVAVIPFHARNSAPEHLDIGNLAADSIIWRLSKAPNLKVISRLSTAVFRGRASNIDEVSAYLGTNYMLSGAYIVDAGRILATAELSSARNGQVVWTDRLTGEIDDLLRPEIELGDLIAQMVHFSVCDAEVEHILTQPLPHWKGRDRAGAAA
ncbi:hypothetical protein [Bradyrhizobium elkanii]|uniref:hypothetical protein n=1 Tax=Bradyrhizobium elkanii TaxID=29448 RepID=UPI003D23D9D4